jgi:hypothetical protein
MALEIDGLLALLRENQFAFSSRVRHGGCDEHS